MFYLRATLQGVLADLARKQNICVYFNYIAMCRGDFTYYLTKFTFT